jgi:hypothetical protein
MLDPSSHDLDQVVISKSDGYQWGSKGSLALVSECLVVKAICLRLDSRSVASDCLFMASASSQTVQAGQASAGHVGSYSRFEHAPLRCIPGPPGG